MVAFWISIAILAMLVFSWFTLLNTYRVSVEIRKERHKQLMYDHIEWRDRMEEKFPDIIGDKFKEDTEKLKGDLKK